MYFLTRQEHNKQTDIFSAFSGNIIIMRTLEISKAFNFQKLQFLSSLGITSTYIYESKQTRKENVDKLQNLCFAEGYIHVMTRVNIIPKWKQPHRGGPLTT